MQTRKQVHLKDYDYSTGAYFVTICAFERRCFFGSIVQGIVQLNQLGRIVENGIASTPTIRPYVVVDSFVVMPNHVHIMLLLMEKRENSSLFSVVNGMKSAGTRSIRAYTNNTVFSVWQRGFYEHIVRNERDVDIKRQYIFNNPLQWEYDELNPTKLDS